jgi:hypothetical protein
MSDHTKLLLIQFFSGACGGIFMAIIVLWMMISNSFVMNGIGFMLSMIVTACLPQCLRFVRKWTISVWVPELVMTAVSFCICFLYSGAVTGSELASGHTGIFSMVVCDAAVLHLCALGAVLIVSLIEYSRSRKK